MKAYFSQPAGLFILAGIGFIILGILPWDLAVQSLDIQVHDTYFVIAPSHITILFAATFLLLAAIYQLMKFVGKPLYKKAGYVHLAFTLAFPCFIVFSLLLEPIIQGRYYDREHFLFTSSIFILILVSLFLAGQIILLLNIVVAIFKRRL